MLCIKYNNSLDFAIVEMMNTLSQATTKSSLIDAVYDAVKEGKITEDLLEQLRVYERQKEDDKQRLIQTAIALKNILEVRPFSDSDVDQTYKSSIEHVIQHLNQLNDADDQVTK